MISPSVTAISQSETRRPSSRYGRFTLSSGIVARINAGLAEVGAAIIVFSRHSRHCRWIEAETSRARGSWSRSFGATIACAAGADHARV
jgi:hypothetical protein